MNESPFSERKGPETNRRPDGKIAGPHYLLAADTLCLGDQKAADGNPAAGPGH